jgi:hypothetical protein
MLISNPLVSTSTSNTSPNGQQLDGQQFDLNTSPNGIQTSLSEQQAAASVISSVGQFHVNPYPYNGFASIYPAISAANPSDFSSQINGLGQTADFAINSQLTNLVENSKLNQYYLQNFYQQQAQNSLPADYPAYQHTTLYR